MYDLSMGSVNWVVSSDETIWVLSVGSCLGWVMVSSTPDSDWPKNANDISGYVAGDVSSAVVV